MKQPKQSLHGQVGNSFPITNTLINPSRYGMSSQFIEKALPAWVVLVRLYAELIHRLALCGELSVKNPC